MGTRIGGWRYLDVIWKGQGREYSYSLFDHNLKETVALGNTCRHGDALLLSGGWS